jgi:Dna[CI] antecedent, DciA
VRAGSKSRGGEARAGDAARSLLTRLDRGGNLERARAVALWKEVAGVEVASHAMGYALRARELVVFVDAPAWATELTALSEDYRSRINRAAGQELVGSMRFTVSKKVAEERVWTEAADHGDAERRPERVTPVAASEQERSQIEAMAASIHDAALREVAVRAAVRALEWRKGMEASKTPQEAAGRSDDPESEAAH